jgi:hypothetical protein
MEDKKSNAMIDKAYAALDEIAPKLNDAMVARCAETKDKDGSLYTDCSAARSAVGSRGTRETSTNLLLEKAFEAMDAVAPRIADATLAKCTEMQGAEGIYSTTCNAMRAVTKGRRR